jgi:hypothetical protein
MFFNGVIAEDGNRLLVTYQEGELVYNDRLYIGKEIKNLIGIINDKILEDEVVVDIHVDQFFAIKYNNCILEEYVYCDYDEAMEAFKDFITKF